VELSNVVHPEKTRELLENGVLTIQFKKVRRKQYRQVVLKIRKPEEKTEEKDGEKRR
jgi:HSP20 family molecular chaperone IbpA